MIVSEAIDLLKNSELKQVSVKDDKGAVLGFINLAILEIYKRFNLWEDEAIITMVDGVKLYKLDGVDANVDIDLSDKQLLMIEDIYEESGEKMVMNDELDEYSVSTPQYHHVEVVEEVPGQTMSVIFRCAPLFLTNEKQAIPVPPQFLEALFHYVGFKAHGSIKSDIKGENNVHYVRFVASCDLIKSEGLIAQDDLESTKFEDRGFV